MNLGAFKEWHLLSAHLSNLFRYSWDLYRDNGLRPYRPVFEMEVLIEGKQIFPGFGFWIVVVKMLVLG